MVGALSRRQLIQLGVTVTGALGLAPWLDVRPGSAGHDVPTLPWPAANDIVANTKLPVFPDRTFKVADYGAVADGKTDNTAAFAKAISAANAAGGGHVVVAKGTYVTGAIYLKSNVDLNLANLAGASLFGTRLNIATLQGAVLTRADLSGANLIFANLFGANLTSANLSGATLIAANLTDANLTFADLTGANLEDAQLSGANFNGADLRGANLANVQGANFANARFI